MLATVLLVKDFVALCGAQHKATYVAHLVMWRSGLNGLAG
jgi:hypothetical protein